MPSPDSIVPSRRAAWRAIGCGATLAGVVFAAYAAAIRGDFLWDDDTHVTANPCVIGPLGLKEIWTTPAANYFPLVLTVFRIEHVLWGLNPFGYHAVTLACHLIGAVLLWRVLVQLRVPGAWLGAALWALHPVQVESVAWISELKNTQSAVFFLLSIGFYLRWLEWLWRPAADSDRSAAERHSHHYVFALLSAALALLSKPSTVMLPVALGLCAWWQRGALRWRDVRALAPFFALSGLASAWTVWEQKFHSGALGAEWNQTIVERLAVAGRALWFYLGKLAWPGSLNFIYSRWTMDISQPVVFLPLIAALIGLFLLWRGRRGRLRPAFFAAAYFVALLFPVLGFFNIYFFRYSFVSDHFQYLASMGPLALAGAAIARAFESSSRDLRNRDRSSRGNEAGVWHGDGTSLVTSAATKITVVAAVLLVALGLRTARQTRVYLNNEALWRDTVARNPAAVMAWLNLGATLAKQHRDDEAIRCFQRAATVHPESPDAQNDAGWGLLDAGYPGPAIPHFERTLQLDPNHADAHKNLGNALRRLGRRDEAIAHYARARDLKPESADAHSNLGSALAEAGRLPDAIAEFETAVRLSPGFAPAHANLGTALGLAGRWRESVASLREALRLQPDYPDAHGKLGVALANIGQLKEAVPQFEEALRLKPAAADLHRSFGQVLRGLGREREAAGHFERAVELDRRQ